MIWHVNVLELGAIACVAVIALALGILQLVAAVVDWWRAWWPPAWWRAWCTWRARRRSRRR